MPKSSNKRQEKLHISIKMKVKLKCLKFINTLSLQKNTTQSHKLQNDQGKTMIAKDSFVPLL